jgi:hypothetical protein
MFHYTIGRIPENQVSSLVKSITYRHHPRRNCSSRVIEGLFRQHATARHGLASPVFRRPRPRLLTATLDIKGGFARGAEGVWLAARERFGLRLLGEPLRRFLNAEPPGDRNHAPREIGVAGVGAGAFAVPTPPSSSGWAWSRPPSRLPTGTPMRRSHERSACRSASWCRWIRTASGTERLAPRGRIGR